MVLSIKSLVKKVFWGKLILVFLFWSSLSCQSQVDRVTKERDLVLSVFVVLSNYHFLQKNFNQGFYDEVLNHYLKITDWQKIFYQSGDVNIFQQLSQYSSTHQAGAQEELENRIPNLLKISYASYDIFKDRGKRFQEFAEDYLSREINFTVKEDIIADLDKRNYPATDSEQQELWRKYLKYLTLNRIVTLSPRDGEHTVEQFRSNENQARSYVLTQVKSMAQNTLTRKSDQYISLYLNAVGLAYDQYTAYFSPVESENQNIHLTGQLEGIGAQIAKVEDGLIEIKGVVPGGPTYKQKALEVGDKIMRVDDGEGNMIDVVALSMNEALSYIRGKKGTVAKFLVKRIDGVIENVEIVRGRVVMEEAYARSTIIETQIPGQPSKKIGYLFLPSFYRDRRNSQAPNSSDDVKKQLLYFNSQGVDGMIFDLRNNGGGFLDDAVNISGFFIEKGPIVRVRGREGEFAPRSDMDPQVVFTKPLVVMINENSASASEIFSAAMQDYGRAVVIGSPQSFGKATVQNVLEFAKQPYLADIAGSMKYTIQKYYRVTGKSTQTVGVTPDVVLPVVWTKKEEEDNPYIQDTLPAIPFKSWDRFNYDVNNLHQNSMKRVDQSPYFTRVKKRLQVMEKRKQEDVASLVYDEAKRKHDQYLSELDKYDLNLPKSKVPYKVLDTTSDSDSVTPERKEEAESWKKQILNDYYVEEGILILNDHLK